MGITRPGLLREHAPATWRDENGATWPVPSARTRQHWNGPIHYRVRAFVFRRDVFTCQGCGRKMYRIPAQYDGSRPLWLPGPNRNLLIVDHIIAVKNGGSCHPENLQAYCEHCNAVKAGTDGRIAYERKNGARR